MVPIKKGGQQTTDIYQLEDDKTIKARMDILIAQRA